jgi:hypothetical protein
VGGRRGHLRDYTFAEQEEEQVVRTVVLSEARKAVIQSKIEDAVRVRKAKVNPTGVVRPSVLSCLENLSNPKLIAAVIDEPVQDIEAYLQWKTAEDLRGKLSSLLIRAMSLPIKPGLEDEFQRILAINVDADDPDWISGAKTVEALLEIAEALVAGAASEKVATICTRAGTRITPQKMAIVFGWLENYIQEGKEFLGWLKWYKEEQRRLAEKL